jgi:hypothetical protein
MHVSHACKDVPVLLSTVSSAKVAMACKPPSSPLVVLQLRDVSTEKASSALRREINEDDSLWKRSGSAHNRITWIIILLIMRGVRWSKVEDMLT